MLPGLPFEQFLQTGQLAAPPTLWHATVLWIGVLFASFLISGAYRWLPPRLRWRMPQVTIPGGATRRSLKPSTLYSRFAPHRPASYYQLQRRVWELDDLTGHWDLLGLFALDVTADELAFRGLPLWLSLAVGVSPVGPVLLGTGYLAVLGGNSGLYVRLLSGTLLAWLWLTGVGYIAVVLHAGTAVIGHCVLRLNDWGRRRKRRRTAEAS